MLNHLPYKNKYKYRNIYPYFLPVKFHYFINIPKKIITIFLIKKKTIFFFKKILYLPIYTRTHIHIKIYIYNNNIHPKY